MLGATHHRYYSDLLDRFESGDLADALRHAIPLGGGEGLESRLAGPGASRPRDDLSFSGRGGAAQLAEAKVLDPSLVVRLTFLAGEVERAMQLARRHGVFGDVLGRLGDHHPAEARSFRVAWAATLAAGGAHAAAVGVLRSGELRPPAAWVAKAIAGGGPSGARVLADAIQGRPEALDAWLESVTGGGCESVWEGSGMRTVHAGRMFDALCSDDVVALTDSSGCERLWPKVDDAEGLGALVDDTHLVVWDRRGRLRVIDLREGEVRTDLRL